VSATSCAACRCHRQSADAALQRSHALFEDGGGRVHDPGVDVPEPLKVEEGGSVSRVFEDVRRSLIDRDRTGPGFGVGLLAGVQRAGGEAEGTIGLRGHLLQYSEAGEDNGNRHRGIKCGSLLPERVFSVA